MLGDVFAAVYAPHGLLFVLVFFPLCPLLSCCSPTPPQPAPLLCSLFFSGVHILHLDEFDWTTAQQLGRGGAEGVAFRVLLRGVPVCVKVSLQPECSVLAAELR